jgi:hypothetical protein
MEKNGGPLKPQIDNDSQNFNFDNSRKMINDSQNTSNASSIVDDMGFGDSSGSEYLDQDSLGGELNKELMDDIRASHLVSAVSPNYGSGNREPTLADFEMVVVLGKGTFGKVFLAKFKFNQELYAIKVIRKDILIEYN